MNVKQKEFNIMAIVLGIIVFISLNSYLFFGRCDLTENGVFTLSPISHNLYQEIPQQVSITYYLSDRLRSYAPQINMIEDLLQEFQATSRGRITVEVVDPTKAERTTEAENYGITARSLQIQQQTESSASVVYSGIVIKYLDRHQTIPFIQDDSNLEYTIVSKIRGLVSNAPLNVGLLSGDSARTVSSAYTALQYFLQQNETVQTIQPGDDIPQEVTVLLVLDWQNLDEFDLFPVDQFIMRGGRVLFAGQGVNFDYGSLSQQLPPAPLGNLPIFAMLAKYGVTVSNDMAADQTCQILGYADSNQSVVHDPGFHYPFWISIQKANVDVQNPITSHFTNLDILWPSSLQVAPVQGITSDIIIRSSIRGFNLTDPNTWITDPYRACLPPGGQNALGEIAGLSAHQIDLAATLEGVFPSYFTDRSIPTRQGETRSWTSIVPNSPASRMIVVSNSVWLSDDIQYSDTQVQTTHRFYNIDLAQNCIDWLAGNEDLLGIRTREARDNSLDSIQDPGTATFVQTLSEIINLGLVPIAVIVFGVVRLLRRRKLSHVRMETQETRDTSPEGGDASGGNEGPDNGGDAGQNT